VSVTDWKKIAKDVCSGVAEAGRVVGTGMQNIVAEASRPTHICSQCGHVGKPRMETKQNGCFAVVLLLCFIIPGILYIIFTSKKFPVCPKCGGEKTMIPLDAPQAQALIHHANASNAAITGRRDDRPCPFCAEPILAQAVVCKHCGRDVPPLR
jgi:hypothetical protein